MTHRSDSINENDKSSFEYPRLRSWYLAKLRRGILDVDHSEGLTPATRISADKDAVYRIVAEAASEQTEQQKPNLRIDDQTISQTLIGLPLFAQLPLAALLICWRDNIPPVVWWSLVVACVAATSFLVLALLFSHRQFVTRIRSYVESRLRPYFSKQPRDIDDTIKSLCDFILQLIERENAIADYALDFLCAINQQGIICAASPSAKTFFGLPATEIIGQDLRDFVVASDVRKVTDALASLQKSTGAVSFETGIKRANGTVLDIAWKAEWSRQESMSFCVGKNISDQRRLERMKQQFLSMIGHDLKTPITSVDCTLELLTDKAAESDRELLQNARDSIASLLRLINQLLELERMEDGTVPLHAAEVRLRGILERSVAAVVPFAKRQNVQIDLRADDAVLFADGDKLQQVVINLLSNAIKFSPAQSVVTISTRIADEVVVQITDHGRGIPTEKHEIIFDRFQQATADDRERGTGLGLSIARAIIEAHGGKIGVKSAVGSGSTFWFSLPIAGKH